VAGVLDAGAVAFVSPPLAAASSAAFLAFFASISFQISLTDRGEGSPPEGLGRFLISLGSGALGAPGSGAISQPERISREATTSSLLEKDIV